MFLLFIDWLAVRKYNKITITDIWVMLTDFIALETGWIFQILFHDTHTYRYIISYLDLVLFVVFMRHRKQGEVEKEHEGESQYHNQILCKLLSKVLKHRAKINGVWSYQQVWSKTVRKHFAFELDLGWSGFLNNLWKGEYNYFKYISSTISN